MDRFRELISYLDSIELANELAGMNIEETYRAYEVMNSLCNIIDNKVDSIKDVQPEYAQKVQAIAQYLNSEEFDSYMSPGDFEKTIEELNEFGHRLSNKCHYIRIKGYTDRSGELEHMTKEMERIGIVNNCKSGTMTSYIVEFRRREDREADRYIITPSLYPSDESIVHGVEAKVAGRRDNFYIVLDEDDNKYLSIQQNKGITYLFENEKERDYPYANLRCPHFGHGYTHQKTVHIQLPHVIMSISSNDVSLSELREEPTGCSVDFTCEMGCIFTMAIKNKDDCIQFSYS